MKFVPDYEIEEHRRKFLEKYKIPEQQTLDELFSKKPPANLEHNLFEDHKRMLKTLLNRPFLKTTELYNACGLSDAEGGIVRDWLVHEDYLIKRKARMSRKGPKALLHQLTYKAYNALDAKKPGVGKESVVHDFYGETAKDFMELNGYRVEREAYTVVHGSKQRMDVFATKDGEGIALEITLSDRNLFENIDKAFADPRVMKVAIIAETKKALTKFRKKVQSRNVDYRGPVEFKVITDYFPDK